MKSLWSARQRHGLVHRLREMSPDKTRLWGTLTPHAAIVHLADSLRMARGEIIEKPILGMLRHAPLKWLAINMLPMPKNIKGPAGYFTTAPTEFDRDLKELQSLIDECTERPEDSTWGENPFFGALTKTQWGKLLYKHIDHHLRQFGC